MLTQEELEFRRNKIGASDAAIILGISPWKTAHQLWQEKVNGVESHSNSAMQRGNEMEPTARAEFERMTGLSVMPKMKINPLADWQIANFDGITFDESVIVEIKCASKMVHDMAIDGKLPDYYFSQVQHQLCVANLEMGFYFSFNGQTGAIVEVKRDQGYIDAMNEEEFKFWNLMTNKTPPPLSDKDYIIREDQEWVDLSKEFLSLLSLDDRKEFVRNRLIELSAERNCIGGGIRVVKREGRCIVDYKAIPELKSVDLTKYTKKGNGYFQVSAV